jgi:protein-tyrosine phosphatase
VLGKHKRVLAEGGGRVESVFVDVHSHVVPSGDDGAQSFEEGLELCRWAAERGTTVLLATPNIWPMLTLTEEREAAVRAALAQLVPAAAQAGVLLRVVFGLSRSAAIAV